MHKAITQVMRVITLLLICAPFARADDLIRLESRPGITMAVQLWTPYPAKPEAVALLLPGGSGNLGLQEINGRIESTRPFLFASWRDALVRAKFAVAVIDAPSDQQDMTQAFRVSDTHMTDLQAAVRELRQRFPASKLLILGHSRGSISAGHLAHQLADQVEGLILLSGLYDATVPAPDSPSSGPGLSGIDLPALKAPILLVHHSEDACPVAPMAAARRLSDRLPLLSITGGGKTSAELPCGPGTPHWFAGQEHEVVHKVVDWINRRSLGAG